MCVHSQGILILSYGINELVYVLLYFSYESRLAILNMSFCYLRFGPSFCFLFAFRLLTFFFC